MLPDKIEKGFTPDELLKGSALMLRLGSDGKSIIDLDRRDMYVLLRVSMDTVMDLLYTVPGFTPTILEQTMFIDLDNPDHRGLITKSDVENLLRKLPLEA